MAKLTLDAYERDLRQFLDYVRERTGKPVGLTELSGLSQAEARAFLAARRQAGAGSRSLLRGLAGIRSFLRFLEREGYAKVSAFASVRTPKTARRLP
ncbi:MAG: site-specific integrase, partial [Hyphomicrobiales bacterium]|nr:site-specific integrase [Hyphomicrobiales bacterium]